MIKKIGGIAFALFILAAAGSGCYQSTQALAQDGTGNQVRGAARGITRGSNGGQGSWGSGAAYSTGEVWQLSRSLESLPAPSEISESEADGLLFMREEEKLAHDIYSELYSLWGLPIFENIAISESAHMEAVKTLLDIYELEDPADDQPGVYTNPALQELYNELIARGSSSLAEALKVGAAIEEIDIQDLQTRLAQTDNLDIQQVYNNLLRGSENHLRAFVKTLETQTGEIYQPQYLSPDEYQAITRQSSTGGGRGGRSQGVGNGGRGGRS